MTKVHLYKCSTLENNYFFLIFRTWMPLMLWCVPKWNAKVTLVSACWPTTRPKRARPPSPRPSGCSYCPLPPGASIKNWAWLCKNERPRPPTRFLFIFCYFPAHSCWFRSIEMDFAIMYFWQYTYIFFTIIYHVLWLCEFGSWSCLFQKLEPRF